MEVCASANNLVSKQKGKKSDLPEMKYTAVLTFVGKCLQKFASGGTSVDDNITKCVKCHRIAIPLEFQWKPMHLKSHFNYVKLLK